MDDTGPKLGPHCGRRPRTARLLLALALGVVGVAAFRTVAADEAGSAAFQQPLSDVRVEGNDTIPGSAISQHIKSRPGRSADDKTIREDVKALYATRWFLSVSPVVETSDAGPVLTFRVVERPIVRRIEYRGNEKVKTKRLSAITGIKPGSPYDPSINLEAARRLEDHYREKGYAFAKVTLLKGGSSEDREVLFEIVEGSVVRVESVKFTGSDFVSGPRLKTQIQTKTMWWPLPFQGQYDPTTIPNDLAVLKEYYQGLGFFDIGIGHKVEFNDDKSRVTITYDIKEGVRYKITDVRYEGNRFYKVDKLAEDRELNPGDYFNRRFLNKDVERMKDLYGTTGRLFAEVNPVPQFSETPGTAVLVYQINEDRPYYIRNINVKIRGDNPHTKTTVVRNYSLIHPGDLADPKLIKKTESRIGGTAVFEAGGPDAPSIDIRRVEAEFDERPTFRGQSDDWGAAAPTGRASYRDSNPFTTQQTTVYPAQAAVERSDGYVPQMNRQRRDAPPGAASLREPANATPAVQTGYAPSGALVASNVAEPGAVYSPPQPRFINPMDPNAGRLQNADGAFDPQAGRVAQIQPQSGWGGGGPAFGNPNPLIPSSPQGDPLDDDPFLPPPGFVDVDIAATEARTGRLMVGAGVNSSSGVVGNIMLTEDNFDLFRVPTSFADFSNGTAFRGAGQKLRIEAVPGNVVSRYLISITDPFVFDTDYSLGGSAFYFQRAYPEWHEERAGGRLNVGRQLSPFLSIGGVARLEDVEISNPQIPTPDILQRAVGSNTLSTLGATLTYDNRDSALLPSEGQYVQASYTQGVGEFVYPRFDLEGTQFFTLFSRPDGSGKQILSFGGQLGYTGDDTPIFERYFAGGFQSLRGFAFRGVGPRQFNVNVGGQFLALGSVQYMFPLLANDSLHGVVFSDFGTVNDNVSLDNFRASIGTGLRVTIPAFGPVPLAFDFAIPVAKADGDRTQVFSFYVGVQR